jgi:hypothetical protein
MPVDCWVGRPEGCGPVEWRSCSACGSSAWWALGAQPGRVEIVQALGARAWQSGDCECLWITGLAGLTGMTKQGSYRPVQA